MNNLYEFYRDCCTRYSDNILFDNSITYGKAFDYALARAAFLQKEGFKKGDIIAILAANSAEWHHLHGDNRHGSDCASARYQS